MPTFCPRITPNTGRSLIDYRVHGEPWRTVEADSYLLRRGNDFFVQNATLVVEYQRAVWCKPSLNHTGFDNISDPVIATERLSFPFTIHLNNQIKGDWEFTDPALVLDSPWGRLATGFTVGYTQLNGVVTSRTNRDGSLIFRDVPDPSCRFRSTGILLDTVKVESFDGDSRWYADNVVGDYYLEIRNGGRFVVSATSTFEPEVVQHPFACTAADTIEAQIATAQGGFLVASDSVLRTNGTRATGLPSNVIRIYKVEDSIYTQVAEYSSDEDCPRPTIADLNVTCGEEECPPGTCPVDCGDTTCCYGSDGVAVTSFLR